MEWMGREQLDFFVRLMVFALPLYAILFAANLLPLQLLVASQSHWLLEGLGFVVAQEGTLLTANGFSFFISPDSTGWKSLLFAGALIMAVPGIARKKKIWGLALGLPAVYAGNLVRVLGIVLIEQSYGVGAAMVAHDWLWRFGLIALVLGVWGLWLWWAKEGGRNRHSLVSS